MSLTDPVADMLTRIRNACSAGHRRVDMPVSKLKAEVARLLRDNHYIADFKVLDDGSHGVLRSRSNAPTPPITSAYVAARTADSATYVTVRLTASCTS